MLSRAKKRRIIGAGKVLINFTFIIIIIIIIYLRTQAGTSGTNKITRKTSVQQDSKANGTNNCPTKSVNHL